MKITSMEAQVLLEALPEEDCRFDHNQDCQEHGIFGINGKCPVAESKELISTALKGNAAESAPEHTWSANGVHYPPTGGAHVVERCSSRCPSAPRPLIDREAVQKAIAEATEHTEEMDQHEEGEWEAGCAACAGWGYPCSTLSAATDAVMKLARPMPTREQIAEALSNATRNMDYRKWETPYGMLPFADAVLVLLNGSES